MTNFITDIKTMTDSETRELASKSVYQTGGTWRVKFDNFTNIPNLIDQTKTYTTQQQAWDAAYQALQTGKKAA